MEQCLLLQFNPLDSALIRVRGFLCASRGERELLTRINADQSRLNCNSKIFSWLYRLLSVLIRVRGFLCASRGERELLTRINADQAD
jgi:hypothetical protein